MTVQNSQLITISTNNQEKDKDRGEIDPKTTNAKNTKNNIKRKNSKENTKNLSFQINLDDVNISINEYRSLLTKINEPQ